MNDMIINIKNIINHRFYLIGAPHGHPTVNNNGGASIEASATASSTSYAGASSASYSGANKSPEANVGDYGHGSATVTAGNGKPGSPMMVHTKTNYDDIFNVRVASSGGDVVQ